MTYGKYLAWRTTHLREGDGILVGADLTQEWLLPWWWQHYQKHNNYPVAFLDFGMSFEKKKWCQERGELIPLRIFADFVKEKEEVDPCVAHFLEEEFGKHFWDCRNVWFQKPLGFLQTPFRRRTIWLDLDCEVRGSLSTLFPYADRPPGFALTKDLCDSLIQYDYPIYNSGVVAFLWGIDLVVQWAQKCIEQNHAFRGDQEVLSHLLSEEKRSIVEVPGRYNVSRCQKMDPAEAVILHWHGVYGKYVIRNQITVDALSFEEDSFTNSQTP